jgi:hypothetical protein
MREQRFAVLLASLLATLIALGMLPAGAAQSIAGTALLGTTLVLALRVGEARPAVVGAGAVAGAVLVATTVLSAASGQDRGLAIALADGLLVALAPPAVVLGVVRELRGRSRISAPVLVGALCLYLLFGMLFAFTWQALDRADAPFFAGGQPATASNCLYFSFITLATVGYGDLTARTPVGHTLAVLEALMGQIYLVTVVSLIIANLGRERAVRR